MKIIFSRKGFDSQYGGVPSPIFPDGRLLSLPIPAHDNPHVMADLDFNGLNLGELSKQLTSGRVTSDTSVHLDPDLSACLADRKAGWRPSFGQIAAAQSHLRNNEVDVNDVFLFFGWFHEVEKHAGQWRYDRKRLGRHVIFGWLQIGEILDIADRRESALAAHPWLVDHPHLSLRDDYLNPRKNNTVYLAREQCSIAPGLPGGGMFPYYRDDLCLTWPGRSRTQWRLPRWMAPIGGKSSLTYHPEQRWTVEGNNVLLKSASKGQEFIFDADRHPESRDWLNTLLTGGNGFA